MAELFDRMVEASTLLRAFDRVEENRGCAGVDGQTIDVFRLQLDVNLRRLQHLVRTGRYRPLPLLRVRIEKPIGGKRSLSIPAVRDRVAQTAALLVLEPVLDPEFEEVSFAYRKGRSLDQAIRRVVALRDLGYRWIVDADIDEYFDTIPHDALLELLKGYVGDERLLELIRLWLEGKVLVDGRLHDIPAGVPQGSPISPLLSNLYLDRLDEAFLRRGHKLVRYADDFIVMCRSRPQAQAALELSAEVLSDLRLKLDPEKTSLTDFDTGFRFLGVQFLKDLAFRPILAADRQTTMGSDDSGASASERSPAPPRVQPPNDAISSTVMGLELRKAFQEAGLEWNRLPEREGKAGRGESAGWPQQGKGEGAAAQSGMGKEKPSVSGPRRAIPPDWDGSFFDHDPLLRTLYLFKQGVEVHRHSRRFLIRLDGATIAEIPSMKVDQVICYGNIAWTTPALQLCMKVGIPVFLVSARGRFYGTIHPLLVGNIELQRRQVLLTARPKRMLEISRGFVRGRIANARTLLLRQARRRQGSDVAPAPTRMKQYLSRLQSAASQEELRGIEGAAAAQYFKAWKKFLSGQWRFHGRRRRPAPDPVNSLLSYGYTVLFFNIFTLLRLRGLNPYFGYYHSLRQGHPGLASDLIEEFRAPLVDATVLALINRKQVVPGDFLMPSPGSPCLIKPEARRKISAALEAALNREVNHPDAGGKCDWRRAIELQVDRLVRSTGESDVPYQPFLIR